MALQLGALRDALLDAGARSDKAERAAEEVAEYETRFGGIEARLGRIEGRLDGMDAKISGLDAKIGGIDAKIGGMDAKIGGMDARISGLDSRLGLMTWVIGINMALTLAVLVKLITLR